MSRSKWTVKYSTIMLMILSAIFLYSSSTFLRTRYSFYLAVAAYGTFYVLSRSIGQKWRVTGTYLWAGLAALMSVMYVFSGAGDRVTTYLSGIIYVFFWSTVVLYLIDNYDKKTILKFGIVNLVLLLVSVLVTINVLTEYPLAARAIDGMAEDITEADVAVYTAMGCGGFGFIYGFTVFSTALATAIKAKGMTWKTKAFVIVAYLLVFYMIFLAEFTTALLITTVVFLLCITAGNKNSILTYVLIATFAVLALVFSEDLTRFLYSVAQKLDITYLETKMGMILEASSRQDVDSLARAKTYMASIDGFLKSPIFGSGTSGEHSQILDTFSTIGLFAIPYVGMLISIFKNFAKRIDSIHSVVFAGTIITLATLNPFVDSTIVSISFMLTPVFLYCFAPKKGKIIPGDFDAK